MQLESATREHLERAKRVELHNENTLIIDGAGAAATIKARVKAI